MGKIDKKQISAKTAKLSWEETEKLRAKIQE